MTVTINGLIGLALVIALGGTWAILMVRGLEALTTAVLDLCRRWWHRWQWRRWQRKRREVRDGHG